MHWLHAHQRQRTAPRKQTSRTRTSREVNMFFKGTTQPAFFVRINFQEANEIPANHILGFGAQDVSEPASHARTHIAADAPAHHSHAPGHVLAPIAART